METSAKTMPEVPDGMSAERSRVYAEVAARWVGSDPGSADETFYAGVLHALNGLIGEARTFRAVLQAGLGVVSTARGEATRKDR